MSCSRVQHEAKAMKARCRDFCGCRAFFRFRHLRSRRVAALDV